MEPPTPSPQKFIRLATYDALVVTTEEYERLGREVRGRVLAGDAGISDVICLRLLEEHEYRYNEIKMQGRR